MLLSARQKAPMHLGLLAVTYDLMDASPESRCVVDRHGTSQTCIVAEVSRAACSGTGEPAVLDSGGSLRLG
jgi:hypothetical protein